MMFDDEGTYLDPMADPDYIRDSMVDDLLTDPVPCAVCGTVGDAWHIVTLMPDAIFFGSKGPSRDQPVMRGLCRECYVSPFVRQPLQNRGA